MFTTTISILGAVALLSPGFLIVELSDARRARAKRSDLELTLRSLVYSVLVHLVFCWWTTWLVREVGHVAAVGDHLLVVAVYVFVVLIVAPVAVGLLIGAHLSRDERSPGPPSLLAVAFGAGQATDAFDFAFQHNYEGAWVIVELAGSTSSSPRYVGGVFGRGSAVGQTPAPHDLFLEKVARIGIDDGGDPYVESLANSPYSLYIPADRIARILVLRDEGEGRVVPQRRLEPEEGT